MDLQAQYEFLVQHGTQCDPSLVISSSRSHDQDRSNNHNVNENVNEKVEIENRILNLFEQLRDEPYTRPLAQEVFKLCVTSIELNPDVVDTDIGNAAVAVAVAAVGYIDIDSIVLQSFPQALNYEMNKNYIVLDSKYDDRIHSSFFLLQKETSGSSGSSGSAFSIVQQMLAWLLSKSRPTPTPSSSNSLSSSLTSSIHELVYDASLIGSMFYKLIQNDFSSKQHEEEEEEEKWIFLQQQCHFLQSSSRNSSSSSSSLKDQLLIPPPQQQEQRQLHQHQQESMYIQEQKCPNHYKYCCSIHSPQGTSILMTRHLHLPLSVLPPKHELSLPYSYVYHHHGNENNSQDIVSTLPMSLQNDLPFIITIREHTATPISISKSKSQPQKNQNEPKNFYHIVLEQECLPTSLTCRNCMKTSLFNTGECTLCARYCSCFCDLLCNTDDNVEEKVVSKVLHYGNYYRSDSHGNSNSHSNSYGNSNSHGNSNDNEVDADGTGRKENDSYVMKRLNKDGKRLIPRIVHQTWYEELTIEKYPNFSRLTESWKQKGWDYRFYNNSDADIFLSTHFPLEVKEAYDVLIPGAFKADLFRYCALFIHGGVYADIDVLLQSKLDVAIDDDIGFMIPLDEKPGREKGHQMCLWNGFMASAPGHPFLAKVIETVVNNIRNRFTELDVMNTLCPNVDFTLSYNYNILFTTGPCILGATVNRFIDRHPQTPHEIGELNITNLENNIKSKIPGKVIILEGNKQEMGAFRFTYTKKNLIMASTDMPDFDDRMSSNNAGKDGKVHVPDDHYSKTRSKANVYGLKGLYKDLNIANELIRFELPTV